MSSDAFTLQVPGDANCRELVPAVAKRYVELVGGSDAERDGCAAAVLTAVNALAGQSEGEIELTFQPRAQAIEVTVRTGGHTTVLEYPFVADRVEPPSGSR